MLILQVYMVTHRTYWSMCAASFLWDGDGLSNTFIATLVAYRGHLRKEGTHYSLAPNMFAFETKLPFIYCLLNIFGSE